MRTSLKPSLLILFSLILGITSAFLPATQIRYQVIVHASQTATTSPTVITKQGYQSVMASDKYGKDAIPCINPRLESLPNTGFVNLLLAWQLIANTLWLAPMLFVSEHIVGHKMPLLKFFAWAVGIGGAFIIAVWILQAVQPEPVQSLCNFNDLYRMVSFMPNWLFIPVPVVAILLGYLGSRYGANVKNTGVTST